MVGGIYKKLRIFNIQFLLYKKTTIISFLLIKKIEIKLTPGFIFV